LEVAGLEYFMGSVKLMLLVYGLSALISMLVAWVIKLIFAGVRRRRVPAETVHAAPASADGTQGKVS